MRHAPNPWELEMMHSYRDPPGVARPYLPSNPQPASLVYQTAHGWDHRMLHPPLTHNPHGPHPEVMSYKCHNGPVGPRALESSESGQLYGQNHQHLPIASWASGHSPMRQFYSQNQQYSPNSPQTTPGGHTQRNRGYHEHNGSPQDCRGKNYTKFPTCGIKRCDTKSSEAQYRRLSPGATNLEAASKCFSRQSSDGPSPYFPTLLLFSALQSGY